MITFNYETSFELKSEILLKNWIENVVADEEFSIGEINYIFCDDEYFFWDRISILNTNQIKEYEVSNNPVNCCFYIHQL